MPGLSNWCSGLKVVCLVMYCAYGKDRADLGAILSNVSLSTNMACPFGRDDERAVNSITRFSLFKPSGLHWFQCFL